MMRQTPEGRKLRALRLQTDRQLLTLIDRRLERGFAAARHIRRGTSECYQDVTRVCNEIGRLLPVVESISQAERTRILSRVQELQGMIEFSSMQAAS